MHAAAEEVVPEPRRAPLGRLVVARVQQELDRGRSNDGVGLVKLAQSIDHYVCRNFRP